MLKRSITIAAVALGIFAAPAAADVTATVEGGQPVTDVRLALAQQGDRIVRAETDGATSAGWNTFLAGSGFTLAKVSSLRAKGGTARLTDSITLPAGGERTVLLVVIGQGTGARSMHVGVGRGCGGEGATTAGGFHALGSVAENAYQVIPVTLPGGASPVHAVVDAATTNDSTLEFGIVVPTGTATSTGSGFLPVGSGAFNRWPAPGSAQFVTTRDACSPTQAQVRYTTVGAGAGGVTSLVSSASPAGPPAGYVANRYLTFSTTAIASGDLWVAFNRARLGVSSLARVFQRRAGAWVDVTDHTTSIGLPAADVALRAKLTDFLPVLIASPVNATAPGVYPDFGFVDGLRLNGTASSVLGRLRLTNSVAQAGTAFTDTALLEPSRSFSSAFAFQVTGGPADGLAFVLHRDPRGAAAVGVSGGALGYGDIKPSVTVEFDTYFNDAPAADPNANHVAVSLDGNWLGAVATHVPPFALANGAPTYVWIDYDAASKSMAIYLSKAATKPAAPSLKLQIDLAARLGGPAFAGFTAGTGNAFATQEFLSWRLDREAAPVIPVDPDPAPVDPGPQPGAPTGPTGPAEKPRVVAGPKLSAILSFDYTGVTSKSTKLTRLVLREVPAGSTVTITCKGKGCAKALTGKGVVKRNVTGTLNLKAYIKRKLNVGAVIKVVVSRAGNTSVTKTLTIRKRAKPVIKSA